MDIGFVGLGLMGGPMAANLVKAGHRVVAWNRSPVKPSDAPGVTIGTLDDVLRCEAVFTMLSDDAAIRSVLFDSGALDSVVAVSAARRCAGMSSDPSSSCS